jgi:hypothetical protein
VKKSDQWRKSHNDRRREQSYELELPSGMTIRCVPFSMTGYLMAKRLPQRMVSAYITAAGGGQKLTGDSSLRGAEELEEVTDFMRLVVTTSVVEPEVVLADPDPDKDQIGIEEIPWEDVEFLFRHLTKMATQSTVDVGGEEVSVETVTNFHGAGEGPPLFDGRRDGSNLPRATEPDLTHQ